MDVNFISYVALTQEFLSFLLSKSTPTSFILLGARSLERQILIDILTCSGQYYIASGFSARTENPGLLGRQSCIERFCVLPTRPAEGVKCESDRLGPTSSVK